MTNLEAEEGKTRVVFQGKLKDFNEWFKIMLKRYSGEATIEAVVEDFGGVK